MSWNFLLIALRPPPSATVMKVKKAARPIGAKINWSHAILLNAGRVPEVFVTGKALERKENQWNWRGDMMKPYAMKRVNRSKSKGGGRSRVFGTNSYCGRGLFLSISRISMDTIVSFAELSLLFADCRMRKDVRVCAQVSAIPPRIYAQISFALFGLVDSV